MIDEDKNLICDGCEKKLGLRLQGYVEIPCPRCKRFNIFDSRKLSYTSHSAVMLKDMVEVKT